MSFSKKQHQVKTMALPNLFLTLSKYGSSESENYLTEAFVYLTKLLLERNPDIGLQFVNNLSGLPDDIKFSNPQSIIISTQVCVDEGRPDIEIKSGTKLIYIEVKHDAPLGKGQLEYYKRKLEGSGVQNVNLVLLTRSRISSQETTLSRDEFHHVCWYEIHNWISNIRDNIQDHVCIYAIEEFLTFLEKKQMSLEQVSWEYIKGVSSLVSLGNTLEVAIIESIPESKIKKSGGWHWRGYFIEGNYFCGVRYDNPLIIVFENNNGTDPTYKHDLNLSEAHFFSLSQAEQLECLINFIHNAYASAARQ
jgi:hypothetical protein